MDYNILNVDLNTLKKIPIKPKRGIYFLYDGHELVYIGQSIIIQRRVMDHFDIISGVKKIFDSYKYIEINEDESLDKIELLFILEYQPKYNKNSLGMGVYPLDMNKKRKSRAKPENELKRKRNKIK